LHKPRPDWRRLLVCTPTIPKVQASSLLNPYNFQQQQHTFHHLYGASGNEAGRDARVEPAALLGLCVLHEFLSLTQALEIYNTHRLGSSVLWLIQKNARNWFAFLGLSAMCICWPSQVRADIAYVCSNSSVRRSKADVVEDCQLLVLPRFTSLHAVAAKQLSLQQGKSSASLCGTVRLLWTALSHLLKRLHVVVW